MNLRPVFYIVGLFLIFLGGAMALPAAVDLAADNPDWRTFAVSGVITVFMGGTLMLGFRGGLQSVGRREAFVLTALSWVVLCGFAALPLRFAGLDLSYTDAYFEAMSGLTTTGSTVMTGLDNAPPGILLWRGLLQGLGGVGIIVMAVAVLPFLRVGGMQLFQAESSDRSEKALPSPVQIARGIGLAYVILMLATAIAFGLAGMTTLEAFVHAMAAISTGGFSTSDSSIGYFASPTIEWIAIVAMLLGSLPFVLYVRALAGAAGELFRDSQVQVFLAIVGGFAAVLAVWIHATEPVAPWDAIRIALFNVATIISTTGFANVDYVQWGSFFSAAIMVLTFIGGCTGSTAGAIKIFRLQIVWMTMKAQILHLIHPHAVYPMRFAGRPVSAEVAAAVTAFCFAYVLTAAALTLGLCFVGLDLVTAFSGAATALGNVGPGVGSIIGPAGNFATLPDAAKWMLSAGMLLGRLELFTVLLMLVPRFWRA